MRPAISATLYFDNATRHTFFLTAHKSIYMLFKNIFKGRIMEIISKQFTNEAEILKVMGHPIRLKIVAGLCTQECNVKHIWECLGLPQATVSQHLALLKNKGVIEGKREGVEVHYSVIHPLAKKIIAALG